jgi:outer membrane protein assembly factor BamE (lipoprotein component of BamABCDE complex)
MAGVSRLQHRAEAGGNRNRSMMCFTSFRRAVIVLALAGCTPNIDYHGYMAKPGAFAQIHEGMPKSEVEATLGSPSTTASVKFNGDSYYYISDVTKQTAFLRAREIKREVVAIRFDKQDKVASFGQYGLEDGRIIDMNSRTTPSKGVELTLIQQLLGNIGTPSPGGGIEPGRTPGGSGPAPGRGGT